MSESRVRPLLEYKFQEEEQIHVQHKDQEHQVMSAESYNQFFGVSLAHGVFYNARFEKEIQALCASCSAVAYKYEAANQELKKFLDQPQNYFSICYINEPCGYTLVANEDLPSGTVVGTYSGLLDMIPTELKGMLPLAERAYDMGLSDFSPIEVDGVSYSLTLRAKKYSDLTRFAIHLPTAKEVDDLERSGLLGSIKRKNVLTENITYPLADYKGVPVRYYKTTKPLKKGDIVGISYGAGYWSNRGRPCLLVREDDSCDLRVAYFDKDLNRYFLSRERISTKQKEEVENTSSLYSLPISNKPRFFEPTIEPQTPPSVEPKIFYPPKPVSYEATPSSSASLYSVPVSTRPRFFEQQLEPRLPPVVQPRVFYTPKPLPYQAAYFAARANNTVLPAAVKKSTVPHSQLPTQSSIFKAQHSSAKSVLGKRDDLIEESYLKRWKSKG